jgi:Domain of unknown function (DUF4332)
MINWNEVQKEITPIKNYEVLCERLRISFKFEFVQQKYNFSMPELVIYTQDLLKGDPRGRYENYASRLITIIDFLHRAEVPDILSLMYQTASREHLELFTNQTKASVIEIAMLLKYLAYWIIPAEKYLSGLVRDSGTEYKAIQKLSENGLRTNLELIQAGITRTGRQSLAIKTEQPQELIEALVNRADFSRLPWASKATISNIIGAGYGSLAKLANADPDRLYVDFFQYGRSIGKNLKLGNEIENSYRIAKIIPKVLQED